MKTLARFSFAAVVMMAWSLQGFAQTDAPDAPPATPPTAPAAEQPTAATTAADAPVPMLPDGSSAVPEGYGENRYEATFKKNPFMAKTTGVVAPPGPGLGEDWELKGMQDLNGVQRVTLLNKKTAQFKRVGPDPDKDGFRLVKMNLAATRKDRSVEIAKGAETATLSFSDAPTPARPGAVPGQPGQPMQPRAPYTGGVQVGNPAGGIRPPGATNNFARPMNATSMPPNVMPTPAGQPQPGAAAAPNAGSRRRLLVPTPAPSPQQGGAIPSPTPR